MGLRHGAGALRVRSWPSPPLPEDSPGSASPRPSEVSQVRHTDPPSPVLLLPSSPARAQEEPGEEGQTEREAETPQGGQARAGAAAPTSAGTSPFQPLGLSFPLSREDGICWLLSSPSP